MAVVRAPLSKTFSLYASSPCASASTEGVARRFWCGAARENAGTAKPKRFGPTTANVREHVWCSRAAFTPRELCDSAADDVPSKRPPGSSRGRCRMVPGRCGGCYTTSTTTQRPAAPSFKAQTAAATADERGGRSYAGPVGRQPAVSDL